MQHQPQQYTYARPPHLQGAPVQWQYPQAYGTPLTQHAQPSTASSSSSSSSHYPQTATASSHPYSPALTHVRPPGYPQPGPQYAAQYQPVHPGHPGHAAQAGHAHVRPYAQAAQAYPQPYEHMSSPSPAPARPPSQVYQQGIAPQPQPPAVLPQHPIQAGYQRPPSIHTSFQNAAAPMLRINSHAGRSPLARHIRPPRMTTRQAHAEAAQRAQSDGSDEANEGRHDTRSSLSSTLVDETEQLTGSQVKAGSAATSPTRLSAASKGRRLDSIDEGFGSETAALQQADPRRRPQRTANVSLAGEVLQFPLSALPRRPISSSVHSTVHQPLTSAASLLPLAHDYAFDHPFPSHLPGLFPRALPPVANVGPPVILGIQPGAGTAALHELVQGVQAGVKGWSDKAWARWIKTTFAHDGALHLTLTNSDLYRSFDIVAPLVPVAIKAFTPATALAISLFDIEEEQTNAGPSTASAHSSQVRCWAEWRWTYRILGKAGVRASATGIPNAAEGTEPGDDRSASSTEQAGAKRRRDADLGSPRGKSRTTTSEVEVVWKCFMTLDLVQHPDASGTDLAIETWSIAVDSWRATVIEGDAEAATALREWGMSTATLRSLQSLDKMRDASRVMEIMQRRGFQPKEVLEAVARTKPSKQDRPAASDDPAASPKAGDKQEPPASGAPDTTRGDDSRPEGQTPNVPSLLGGLASSTEQSEGDMAVDRETLETPREAPPIDEQPLSDEMQISPEVIVDPPADEHEIEVVEGYPSGPRYVSA